MCSPPLRADSAYSSVAIPFPSECARHTSGPSRVVAEAAEKRVGSKDPLCPCKGHRLVKVMHLRGSGPG